MRTILKYLKRTVPMALAMLVVAPVVVLVAQDSTVVTPPVELPTGFYDLINMVMIGITTVASAVWGAVKGWLKLADQTWFNFVKPVQPLIVMGLGMLFAQVPMLGVADPEILTSAPLATLVAVGIREAWIKIWPWIQQKLGGGTAGP